MGLTPDRLLADDGIAVHVRDEGVWNFDGAIGLLVVLEDCEVGAAYGQAAAVDGVKEVGFFRAGGTVFNVCAAGLEGFEVGAGGDLAVEVLSGEPDFEVVGFGGGEAHVAGAEKHAAIREVEFFQDDFGVTGEGFVLFVRVFRPDEFYELYSLELMLADHAADVLAVGAGFATEAGSVGAEGDRELGLFEGLVAVEIGDGDLGGGDEPVVVVLVDAGLVGAFVVAVKEVFGELGG